MKKAANIDMKLTMLTDHDSGMIVQMLEDAGFEAFFVGGCVRDAVLSRINGSEYSCSDTDITTNALPYQIKEVFSAYRTVDTGIAHGTVTVIIPSASNCNEKSMKAEVTTYRIDGNYADNRHPDSVNFTSSLREDLERRDFTVNAIACDSNGNIVDPFGGIRDIEARQIKAVGNPEKRFREDALRIMRALRFSAVLGFDIAEDTVKAMSQCGVLLRNIAQERLFTEFVKLLKGSNAAEVIRQHIDILSVVIPEFTAAKGFDQNNPYHKYDVLEHCIRAMDIVGNTVICEDGERERELTVMKLAALFHDIGKPQTYFTDEKNIGHFYGHPNKSCELVKDILRRFKADNFTVDRVSTIVKYHDLIFEKDRRLLKKWMNRFSAQVLFQILEVKRADNHATGNMTAELGEKFDDIEKMMLSILEENECFSLKSLDITGQDLIDAGFAQSPQIGKTLEYLLNAVIEEKLPNKHDVLLRAALDIKE